MLLSKVWGVRKSRSKARPSCEAPSTEAGQVPSTTLSLYTCSFPEHGADTSRTTQRPPDRPPTDRPRDPFAEEFKTRHSQCSARGAIPSRVKHNVITV